MTEMSKFLSSDYDVQQPVSHIVLREKWQKGEKIFIKYTRRKNDDNCDDYADDVDISKIIDIFMLLFVNLRYIVK